MSISIDPVCGMNVDTEKGRSLEHAGQRYYFCSQRCVEKFSADPDKYLNPVASTPAPIAPSAGGYTLPEMRHGTGAGKRHAEAGCDRIRMPYASANRAQ
jgi:YHS domain-containing protein